MVPTFACPNCGSDVRADALACRECGSDADTGWSDATLYDGLDLPAQGDEESEWHARRMAAEGRARSVPWTWGLVLLFVAALLGLPTCR